MPRLSLKCCVAGCSYQRPNPSSRRRQEAVVQDEPLPHKILFRFPDDAQMCVNWVRECGNEALLDCSVSVLHKGALYVCEDHFCPKDFLRSRTLEPHAVPSVFDHTGPLSEELMRCFINRNNLELMVNMGPAAPALVPDPLRDHLYCGFPTPGEGARVNVQDSLEEEVQQEETVAQPMDISIQEGSVHSTESLQEVHVHQEGSVHSTESLQEVNVEEEVVWNDLGDCVVMEEDSNFILGVPDYFPPMDEEENLLCANTPSVHVNITAEEPVPESSGLGENGLTPKPSKQQCRRSLKKDFGVKRAEVTPRRRALWKEAVKTKTELHGKKTFSWPC